MTDQAQIEHLQNELAKARQMQQLVNEEVACLQRDLARMKAAGASLPGEAKQNNQQSQAEMEAVVTSLQKQLRQARSLVQDTNGDVVTLQNELAGYKAREAERTRRESLITGIEQP